MKKLTQEQLNVILDKHELLLKGESNSEKADLRFTDLTNTNSKVVDLPNVDLRFTDLVDDLLNVDLRGADLTNANLTGLPEEYKHLRRND